jgi:predicted RNase H-like HicB family nuclease
VAEAGFWVAWGIPTRGRERQALQLLKESITGYLDQLVSDGRIERFDTAILKPQSTELGGFILIQGSKPQLAELRGDHGFQQWVTRIQLVADKVGIVDTWAGEGLAEAFELYEEALRKLD